MTKKDNYIRCIADQIRTNAEDEDLKINGIDALFDMYAVLAMSKGPEVTDEDVHDTWAAWANQHNPDDESIVPFEELSKRVQSLDSKYTKAVLVVARSLPEFTADSD